MARRLAACLWCCLAVHAAFESAALAQAPVLRIRQKMKENLNATPDFLCSVSFERSERTGKSAPATLPALSLEGGLIGGRELYLQPPSDAGLAGLREVMALFNTAGTGAFAKYSRAVFVTADATFYDAPGEEKSGRKLSRVDFAMPREGSAYSLPREGGFVALGYSGSIWIDPDSLEVARLAVQADGIPQEFGIKAITQTLEYARTSLRSAPVLLPVTTDLVVEYSSGKQARVTGRFSDCHPYAAKPGDRLLQNGLEAPAAVSSQPLSRAEPAPAASLAKVSPKSPPAQDLLPPKTRIETILEEAIDERTTREGSRLTFNIVREIKAGGRVIVPRGSVAMGHVTRIIMQNYIINTSVKRYYLVGIQFDSIQVGGQVFPVRANLEAVGEPAKGTAFIPYSHDPDKWGNFDDTYQLLLCPTPDRDESFLGIVREFLRLGKMRVYWSNQEPQR